MCYTDYREYERRTKGIKTKFKCLKHNVYLRTVEDYPGALVHDGCPEIFTVIDGHLCILDNRRWIDVETKECRLEQS